MPPPPPRPGTPDAPLPAPRAFESDARPLIDRYTDASGMRPDAFAEAHATFVEGCRLTERWRGQPGWTVMEVGFGLGIGFLAALAAWRADPDRPARLEFVAVERQPVDPAELGRAYRALGLRGADADALLACWPLPLPGVHRRLFADGAVALTRAFGDVDHLLQRLDFAADAIFLDRLTPEFDPRVWTPDLFRSLARHSRPGATLASHCTAAPMRGGLVAAGFEVADVAGGPGLGQACNRIEARYAPRWRTYPPPPPRPLHASREVVVIGAGLSGCAVAAALAGRGWRVTLLDAAAAPASAGSSQPAVADHLHVSPDDNLLARLTRAALLLGPRRDPCGKLQVAANDREAESHRALVERLRFPAGYVQALDRDSASDVAGVALARGALWLPLCGLGRPVDACAELLAVGGDAPDRRALDGGALQFQGGAWVERLEHREGRWIALDAEARPLAAAPVVVLANAGDAPRLAGATVMPLRRLRGQTTPLAEPSLAGLRTVLGGSAYACPLGDGRTLVGSTFDDLDGTDPDDASDASNLDRLASMLAPGAFDPIAAAGRRERGRLGFRYAAQDRLPLIGALPDEAAIRADAAAYARNDRLPLPRLPGLFAACGYGSRGMLWAALAAETIADALDGAPAPIERDLLAAIDPARFLRRGLRSRAIR